MCPSQRSSAALRLARAKLRWRRAADELLISAIFDDLSLVRRDGDCYGRAARMGALAPALAPAMVPAMTQARKTGARRLPAPVF